MKGVKTELEKFMKGIIQHGFSGLVLMTQDFFHLCVLYSKVGRKIGVGLKY